MRLNNHLYCLSGHALTEYGLILGLLVIMLIGFLGSLGWTLNDSYGNTILAMRLNPQATGADNDPKTEGSNNAEHVNIPLTDPRYHQYRIQKILDDAPKQTIKLNDGQIITIPNPDLNTLQDTLGPSGSTDLVQALVQRMITALQKVDANPEVITELSEFANKTHTISRIQKGREADLLAYFTTDPVLHSDRYTELRNLAYLDLNTDNTLFKSFTGTSCPDCATKDATYFLEGGELYVSSSGVANAYGGQTSTMNVSHLSYVYELSARNFYTQQVLEEKNLGNLNQVFSPIGDYIVRSAEDLENKVQFSSGQNYESYFENGYQPTWLTTRINANKVCTLSKDSQCLK
jgi:hypothetical protein